ncbi:MAG TPA: methyltransferase domain-containing protein [Pseudomonadales bacterium]|nr:methyltransferase domain-containing protein [Pseudomonadales bacterium]
MTLDSADIDVLALHAKVWEAESEVMLYHIGVDVGWRCVDLGCGPEGLLGPLSRRTGRAGSVIAVNHNEPLVKAAKSFIDREQLVNVSVHRSDPIHTELPAESADFCHARFMVAETGLADPLLEEMLRLTKPGGYIALQEPDSSCWSCFPPSPEWKRLKSAITQLYAESGGDLSAGTRTFGMLKRLGLADVNIRAAVLPLYNCHPYMRWPIYLAESLKPRLIASGIMKEDEFENTLYEYSRHLDHPETVVISFVMTQVWGRKPG